MQFLEIFYREKTIPTREQIQTEVEVLEGLRAIQVLIEFPDPPLADGDAFFYLLAEEYPRYDAILPESLEIRILPEELDVRKEIHKFISRLSKPW